MPDDLARVGIVVRTKNRAPFLQRALADIARQEYRAWRVCVVNDGGDRADVARVIESFPEDLRSSIDVAHNDHSRGRSAAANQGIAALTTEYLVVHDDDDLWDETFLTATVSWLDSHPDDAAVVARTEIVYEERDASGAFVEVRRTPFWADVDEIRFTDLLEINRAVPIACLYRRGLHEAVGLYREDLHAAEDWDFYLRATVRHHFGFLEGRPLAFWMHRVGVGGDLGNSMYAFSDQHRRYDEVVRDDALRRFVDEYGPGLPLFLVGFLRGEITRTVREELARQLDEHPSDLQRIARRLRRLPWWPGHRSAPSAGDAS